MKRGRERKAGKRRREREGREERRGFRAPRDKAGFSDESVDVCVIHMTGIPVVRIQTGKLYSELPVSPEYCYMND